MPTDFRIENLNILAEDPLLSPSELKEQFPISEKAIEVVENAHKTLKNILAKEDKRKVVVVGPCSIHDTKAAREYAQKLVALASKLEDELYLVMRVYFEKPRSRIGWQGLINDPHLDGSADIATGLAEARKLMLDITNLGLPVAGEALDIVTPPYVQDLISWTAIGARTTESQSHRKMASGLTSPVGFKNSTDGSIDVAIDAIFAAAHPHHFLSVNPDGDVAVVRTKGNPNCHIVLRGGHDGPNFDEASIVKIEQALEKSGLPKNIMVDCSHANSGKDFRKQSGVLESVATQIVQGNHSIMGVMIESNLHEGNQKMVAGSALKYGVSITDGCIGWDETAKILGNFANQIKK